MLEISKILGIEFISEKQSFKNLYKVIVIPKKSATKLNPIAPQKMITKFEDELGMQKN